MPTKRQLPNGTWEIVIKRKALLEKPLGKVFPTLEEGLAWASVIEANLDRGLVSPDIVAEQLSKQVLTVRDLLRQYEIKGGASLRDLDVLMTLTNRIGHTPLGDLNVGWVDSWITLMKRQEQLSPATIRGRVGVMARATKWGIRQQILTLPDAPFTNLATGYSHYSEEDSRFVEEVRVDIKRDRRLEPGEYERILAVIDSGLLPRKVGGPEPIVHKEAMRCLFILAVESAMRMSEMYRLRIDNVSFSKKTVFLSKTKNGSQRQVPLSSIAIKALQDYLQHRGVGANPQLPEGIPKDMVFPWYPGETGNKRQDMKVRKDTTDRISKLFNNHRAPGIVQAAGCEDLHFHDLRHEATSRLYEKTKLTDLQIMKITGHSSTDQLARYANLRGSDLADAMW